MFYFKRTFGSDQEIKSLLTVPYPLAELCFTVGNFKQSLFGLVEANISESSHCTKCLLLYV